MTSIALLATAWGSKHGGINVVNVELARALADVLGEAGRVLCVVPHAQQEDIEDAMCAGVTLVTLGLPPDNLPDYFDRRWVAAVEKKLAEASASKIDWCIGHDVISGDAALTMKLHGGAQGSVVISHMSYVDYQGVKHPDARDVNQKIKEQERILRAADTVLAIGPLLAASASDVVDKDVTFIVPGLSTITPRPSRNRFTAVSFGRFERANDRIKQIQLVAEGFAVARQHAIERGAPASLQDNPTLKLIGVSPNDEESSELKRVMAARAGGIVNLHPLPYVEDRQALYREIAGSSVALMLSWHEGFGLTGWEAIAAEVPLIVTKQSGLYKLLHKLGLQGLVHHVQVDGSYGDDETPNFTDEDRQRVAASILGVANDYNNARAVAKNLKDTLDLRGFTWTKAARTVLDLLGVPTSSGDSAEIASVSSVPTVGGLPYTTLCLATYLTRMREVTGMVTLAGDTKARPLEDVFVELEVTRGGKLDASAIDDDGEAESPTLELELRRRRSAPWRQITETIPALDLLDFAHRTLVVGAAGTGKSTLLRWLACQAADRRATDDRARIPIWLPRLPSHNNFEKDFAVALARQALAHLDLDVHPSAALDAIRQAIVSGQALVLIDSLDESSVTEQDYAAEWLEKLQGRVVLASRPLLQNRPVRDVVTVTLHGIPSIAAEQLLHKYFAGEAWVDGLLDAVRSLADGPMWLETPVLLGLAATLYRSNNELPRATIDLYRRAVDHLLRSDRVPPRYHNDAFRGELQSFARERLLPKDGAPRVLFDAAEVPDGRHELYKRTGLFEGGFRFRFTHLTMGEYLAAEGAVDVAGECTKLLAIAGRLPEGHALEVLPMALAIHGVSVLQALLTDARDRDLSDHRLLRLLLRAIGYGGQGVHDFCREHAVDVLRLIADRLDAPSGRFGEAEVALMDAGERAFLAMRDMVVRLDVERVFARLLRLPGNAGTEAHLATWILGARPPERRECDSGLTIERQARALVRANIGIDGVLELTQGVDNVNQCLAACHVARSPELLPKIRSFLYHKDDIGRRWISANLAKDPQSEPDWRERLGDEDRATRVVCVRALTHKLPRETIYLPRLLDMLTHDPSDEVRAAVVDALAKDSRSLPWIRKILAETIHVPPPPISGDFFALREAAVRALAADPDSEALIGEYILEPGDWFLGKSTGTLQALLRVPEWRKLLLQKLSSPEVTINEIKAMASLPEAESLLRGLLDNDDAHIVQSAVEALGERVGRSKLMSLLTHPAEIVRCAAIGALARLPNSAAVLRRFLVGTPAEQVAAIIALSHDTEAMTVVGDKLLRSHSANVLTAAVDALSEQPIAFTALRDRFDEWRLEPEYGQADSNDARDLVAYGTLRAKILGALAREPLYRALVVEALNDPHSAVRGAAVRALAHDPAMLGRLRQQFSASNRDHQEIEAFRELMRDQPFVMKDLLYCLNEDFAALRFAAFRHFVDHDTDRRRLKQMLLDYRLPEDWRATIVGPLMRDPTLIDMVRGCINDPSRYVREQTLRFLKHDRRVRETLRARLLEQVRLVELARQNWSALRHDSVLEILASDPDAHPILAEHLASDDPTVVKLAASLLRDYPEARPKLVEFLNHPYVEVQCAAMGALGEYEPAREALVAALEPNPREDPKSDTERKLKWEADRRRDARRIAAADALKDVPELRVKFRELLDHNDKQIREAAIHAVGADRSPEAVLALRARLGLETEEHLRSGIIVALRFDPGSIDVFRERLQNDYQRNVRMQAAYALGFGDLMPAHAVRKLPSVAPVCGVLAAADGPGLDALRAFLNAPRDLDLDGEPELGEQVLAWACARLGWAHELDRERDGQVLGEVATREDRLSRPGHLLVMRVAMDVFDVPRERFLRPNHNLMVVWDVVRHVAAADPPALVLACADVAFEHLQPPPLAPGEVRFGPTFFGFRLNRSKPSPEPDQRS